MIATSPQRHGRRYPWRDWFAKKEFTVLKGRDYDISMISMRQMALTWAAKLRLRVETSVYEQAGAITVTVVGRLDPPPKKSRARTNGRKK